MDKQQHGTWVGIPEESTVMNGPDYVALVIEWDEEPVEAIAETEVTRKTLSTKLAELPVRTLATAVAAAAGAIGLAVWGVHRLRAA